jgi:hypothetical protein
MSSVSIGDGAARPAADQDVLGGSTSTVVALAPRVVCGNVVVISARVPTAGSGAPEVVKRSILKAVIARHEPQALTAQIPGRDRHGDTARAYLSTAARSAPHGADGRVSLQSRMRLRSANSHALPVLTNVSRYRRDAIMILRSPSTVNR